MLDAGTVTWVEGLLAKGDLSQNEVAARTGVARGTVQRIARKEVRSDDRPESVEARGFFEGGLPVLCPECGRNVHLPRGATVCHACRTGPPPEIRPEFDENEPIELEFRSPGMAARYREVRECAHRRRALAVEPGPDE